MPEELLMVPALQSFTIRAPEIEDAEKVADFFNVISIEVVGKKHYETGMIERTWQAPKFDKDQSVRLVFAPDGELAAYVEVGGHQQPHVQIGVGVMLPAAFQGKGIGTALLQWGEGRAREILLKAPKDAQVVMTAACNEKDLYRTSLYQRYGMKLYRHFFKMVIDIDTPPQPAKLPAGIVIRPYDEETELYRLSQCYLDSFQDHFGFSGQTLEDIATYIRHLIDKDPNYDPGLWFVAVDGEEMVGLSICAGKTTEDPLMGYVNVLGVVREYRKRGLGMALLTHSFAELHQRGSQRVGLSVDASSLTGATRLYEKAGMDVRERFDLYQKILRDGEVLFRE
ncbi:MAG TPA: GNAT family N-acetyltransferase [Anaerolineales bacterium]|jgi:ribosomal protein S18 acetylase RimI-like enzyme|nr:GNAT family N-acetyltransferase [Anaerolineales bacterium]